MNYIEEAKRVFDIEIKSLLNTRDAIGPDFEIFVKKIRACTGRMIITGMGKSGHISRKIAATMQSLGIKSYFMHPGEALHGDLGLLTSEDLILAISNSGETDEILNLIPTIEKMNVDLISIIGRKNSSLEKYSSATIILPEMEEAFLESLVPTSSTTTSLVLGDALAIVVSKANGFTKSDFGIFHPSGMLGKRLTLKVKDLMLTGEDNSFVHTNSTIEEAVFEMCCKAIGGVGVIDKKGTLIGVFTDGDLRRSFTGLTKNSMNETIGSYMTTSPLSINENMLVSEVVEIIKNESRKISFFPVINDHNLLVGSLRVIDIVKCGLMG